MNPVHTCRHYIGYHLLPPPPPCLLIKKTVYGVDLFCYIVIMIHQIKETRCINHNQFISDKSTDISQKWNLYGMTILNILIFITLVYISEVKYKFKEG